jgi:DNA polymerase elongation subunit (family B)
MCYKTLGVTMVIYKYEGDTYDYPFIMEHREFYKEHLEVVES